MHEVAIKEAQMRLAELIDEVASGEEVVIKRNDGTAFKIVHVPHIVPRPKFGSARGLIEMSDDFDEPLTDFDAYAP